MSLFLTSGYACCQGCNKPYKRLSTHISQNEEVCGSHYKTIPDEVGHDVAIVQGSDCAYFNNEAATAVAAQRQTSYCLHTPRGEERHVVTDNVVDVLMHDDNIDDFQVFDNPLPCNQELDIDINYGVAPDGVIFELYKEMQELQSNPLDLNRFSCKEKVHIVLLQIMKEVEAPLKAFSCILNWAAKANDHGHVLKVDCQPSRWKLIHKMI